MGLKLYLSGVSVFLVLLCFLKGGWEGRVEEGNLKDGFSAEGFLFAVGLVYQVFRV